MEYVPHDNLFHFLRSSSPIGWRLRLKIAKDIAEGMKFLHESQPPMLHRDLKTPNVLMASLDSSSEIVAKLTDFGETRNLFSRFKGREGLSNPSWLAPEIMAGEVYTEKADVYSFGIILWELFFRQVSGSPRIHENILLCLCLILSYYSTSFLLPVFQYPYSEHKVAGSRFTFRLEDAILSGLRPTFLPIFTVDQEGERGSGDSDPIGSAAAIEGHNKKIRALPACLSSYSNLAEKCWDRLPTTRPSFSDCVKFLVRIMEAEETKEDQSVILYDPDLFPVPTFTTPHCVLVLAEEQSAKKVAGARGEEAGAGGEAKLLSRTGGTGSGSSTGSGNSKSDAPLGAGIIAALRSGTTIEQLEKQLGGKIPQSQVEFLLRIVKEEEEKERAALAIAASSSPPSSSSSSVWHRPSPRGLTTSRSTQEDNKERGGSVLLARNR
jgi:serine/threonine protein kinase